MADMKVLSRETVIEVRFREGEAPDTRHPFNDVIIRPDLAIIRVVADSDRPLLRTVILQGPRVLKDGLGVVHQAEFYPGDLPTWLSVVVGEAKGLANG